MPAKLLATVQVRLLGPPSAKGDTWQPIRPSNYAALLCYLAYRNTWVTREEAALLFYPEISTDAARTRFRQLLRRTKKLPGGGGLEAEGEQLRFKADTDVQTFREALGQGDWAQACQLYRGQLLEGFDLRNVPGFEYWLDLERSVLHAAWREAAVKHADSFAAQGHHDQAARLLEQVLHQDLLAEDVVQQLMRYRYQAGQREAALKVFGQFEAELARELELDPLEETQQLAALIRQARTLTTTPPETAPRRVPLSVQHPPHLVGRENAFNTLRRSQHPVVLVAGEPGVGKTRLARDAAPLALYLRCLEGLENVPYYPLVTHVRANLTTLPDLGPYLDELARLVPETAPGRVPPTADSTYNKTKMLETWARYLQAYKAEDEGFDLLLDDIQWADAATLELLLYVAAQGNLRVMACYRSSEVHDTLERTLAGLRSGKLATLVELEPFGSDEVAELVASLSAQHEGPPLFSRWLHERTGGNAFFTLETLKALFETGLIHEEGSVWQSQVDDLTRDYSELEVPPAVAEVVQRRVRSLSAETQRVLPVAAVVREGFTPELLSKLTGLSPFAVLEVLDEAEQNGLLETSRFSHDLLRESLYASLGDTRRSFVHAQVAELLSDEADPVVVGEHWFAADNLGKALQLWRKAVDVYLEKGLLSEVEPLLRRVIDLTPASRERTDSLSALTETYRLTGRLDEAETTLAEMLKTVSTPAERAWALSGQTQIRLNRGDLSGAAAAAAEAYHQATLQADPDVRRSTALVKAMVYQAQGNFTGSVELIRPIVTALRSEALPRTQTVFLAKLGSDYSCLGRYEEALSCYEEAFELSKRLEARRQKVLCVNNLLSVYNYLGRPEEMLPLALEALTWGRYDASYALRYQLAKAYLHLGDYQNVLPHAHVITEECPQPRFLCGAWLCIAETYYHLAKVEASTAAIQEALAIAEQTDVPQTRLWAVITVASYGNSEQLARARDFYRQVDPETVPAYLKTDLEQVSDRLSQPGSG